MDDVSFSFPWDDSGGEKCVEGGISAWIIFEFVKIYTTLGYIVSLIL